MQTPLFFLIEWANRCLLAKELLAFNNGISSIVSKFIRQRVRTFEAALHMRRTHIPNKTAHRLTKGMFYCTTILWFSA